MRTVSIATRGKPPTSVWGTLSQLWKIQQPQIILGKVLHVEARARKALLACLETAAEDGATSRLALTLLV